MFQRFYRIQVTNTKYLYTDSLIVCLYDLVHLTYFRCNKFQCVHGPCNGLVPKSFQGHFCFVEIISCTLKMFPYTNQKLFISKSAVILNNSKKCSTILKKSKAFEDIPGPPNQGLAIYISYYMYYMNYHFILGIIKYMN